VRWLKKLIKALTRVKKVTIRYLITCNHCGKKLKKNSIIYESFVGNIITIRGFCTNRCKYKWQCKISGTNFNENHPLAKR